MKLSAACSIEPSAGKVYSAFLWMLLSLPGFKLKYKLEDRYERRKLFSIFRFLVAKAVSFCLRPDAFIKAVKRDLLRCRRFSLSTLEHECCVGNLIPKGAGYTPSRTAYMQISMLSRALPLPLEDGTALEEQLARLTAPSKVLTPRDFKSLKDFCARSIGAITPIPRPLFSSISASFGSTRKEGGKGKALSSLWWEHLYPEDGDEGFAPGALGESWFGIQSSMYHRAGVDLFGRHFSMKSRAIPVRERGWKVRMVSCSDPIRSLKSEAYRRGLFSKLRKFRPIRTTLMGEPTHLRFSNVSRGAIVYSADLSAATDELSHDAIRAVCEATNIPFDLVTGGTIDGRTMTAGTLMGIPLSWPFLSIIHYWAIRRMNIPDGTFHLKGDDLIALWSLEEVAFYEHHLPLLTGMKLNATKTLLGKSHGVFCERFFSRKGDTDLFHMGSVVSLRPFVSGERDRGFPPEIAVTDYLWSLRGRLPWDRIYAFYKAFFLTVDKSYLGLGPLIYLPPYLGGLGVLPKDPDRLVPPLLQRLMSAIHDGRGSEYIRALQTSKRYKKGTAEEAIATQMSGVIKTLKIEYKIQGHKPGIEYYLTHQLELAANWHSYQLPRDGPKSFLTFVKLIGLLARKKTLVVPQQRLSNFTYHSTRDLCSRLGAAGFDLTPLGQAGSAVDWYEGLLTVEAKDVPLLFREGRLDVGSPHILVL
jgi:hypothetical protein